MRSQYDPRTRRITLAPSASLYTQFHELAHQEQHEKQTYAYIAWCLFCRVRLIRHVVTFWIELDAYRRAKVKMIKLGIWNDEACQEAKNNLISYATLKEPV